MDCKILGKYLLLVMVGFSPSACRKGPPATLKVLLPEEFKEAELKIQGNPVQGSGTERVVQTSALAPGKKHTVQVEASIKPNNYTTIYRKKEIEVEANQTVEVDLRQEKDDVFARWYPTPPEVVQAMCKLAGVSADDVVYDLGCGDGRIVIAAVKEFGAKKGIGVDIDPQRVQESRTNAKKEGLTDKLEFRQEDVQKIESVSDASVVMLYMGEKLTLAMMPMLRESLKPGSRIVSHRFTMGDWKPQKTETIHISQGQDAGDHQIHLWVIEETAPARLRVLLPEEYQTGDTTAELKINERTIEGKGTDRTVETRPLERGKKHAIKVEASIKPNNYTTKTRRKTVTVQAGEVVEVDLRKEEDDVVVRYVPTPQEAVEAMCKLARVSKDDVVFDLGCGDGRIVITAVKDFGAKRGVGVDIDLRRIKESRENARHKGVEDRVEFRQEDVQKLKDVSQASVVMLYMGNDLNLKMRPMLQKSLKPGSRIVSHRFTMGDWKPKHTEKLTVDGDDIEIHLWIVGEK